MARFLVFWRANLTAPWPTDPVESLKLLEKMFAAMDDSIKKGAVEEYGFFPDGTSGYSISKGETTDVFRSANMWLPYLLFEIHEIIPYEKAKEILRAVLKAQIAAAKK